MLGMVSVQEAYGIVTHVPEEAKEELDPASGRLGVTTPWELGWSLPLVLALARDKLLPNGLPEGFEGCRNDWSNVGDG